MGKGSARAYSNMALIKYWGKRDETLILPANSSLSMTLDQFYTTTHVTFDQEMENDQFILNNKTPTKNESLRVTRFLNRIRMMAGTTDHVKIESVSNIPTSAGLASSAAGFAALAGAVSRALELPLDGTSLSRLARQGSGSASRSIYGGFVEWRRGVLDDGADSYAVPVTPRDHWDIMMIVASIGKSRKSVSSREGMRRCMETSPYYQGWLETVESDLNTAKKAIKTKNFSLLGSVVESNALKMHALPLSANPPFTYWKEATLSVMRKVQKLRNSGVPAYYTMDAGPNVAILCEPETVETIQQALLSVNGVSKAMICRPGSEMALLDGG